MKDEPILLEVDLRQAESRFIAWFAPMPTLQQMYEDRIDIHRFVASKIFKCEMSDVTDKQRQLGKKGGHARNYGTGANTFAETCLKENDFVISTYGAQRILDGYSEALNGELEDNYQAKIKRLVETHRFLENPFGFRRDFHDRMGDSLLREAYAQIPQSTIPIIINELIWHLWEEAPKRNLQLRLVNQVHDAAYLRTTRRYLDGVVELIREEETWNPELQLDGGPLRIPIEIKAGMNLKEMEVIYEGH